MGLLPLYEYMNNFPKLLFRSMNTVNWNLIEASQAASCSCWSKQLRNIYLVILHNTSTIICAVWCSYRRFSNSKFRKIFINFNRTHVYQLQMQILINLSLPQGTFSSSPVRYQNIEKNCFSSVIRNLQVSWFYFESTYKIHMMCHIAGNGGKGGRMWEKRTY